MRAQFTNESGGTIVRASDGYEAFVPAPALRSLDLSERVVTLLAEASDQLGALRGTGSRLRNPSLLITPYLRREAVLSSRIEGTQASLSDVYAAEAGQTALIEAADTQEVANYVRAHEWAIDELARLPLSLRLIRGMHRRLMQGVRGREHHPGELRRYQNWIGGPDGASAVYVPPPVPEMHERLDDLERYLHEAALPPLVQAGVIHYQFEAIHPFGDGNGRVGRLLISLFLAARDLMPRPLLYLSAYFERNRDAYYDGLLRVSTHADWDGWLEYFLRGVGEQAREAAEMAEALLGLEAGYRQRLLAAGATNTALGLIETLFINPIIDARRAQEVLDVSAPTARAALRTLEAEGILTEITGRAWRRTYRAEEILAALQE